jgi:hypothetical protein
MVEERKYLSHIRAKLLGALVRQFRHYLPKVDIAEAKIAFFAVLWRAFAK